MADNQGGHPPAAQNWLNQDVVAIPGPAHNMPKHPEKVLPIFNPDEKQPTKKHFKQFKMKVRLLNVRLEDAICRLFPYTFTGKSSAWYFSLPQGSITSWNAFEEFFLKKYGDDKTPADLVMELSRMKIGTKERVKDF